VSGETQGQVTWGIPGAWPYACGDGGGRHPDAPSAFPPLPGQAAIVDSTAAHAALRTRTTHLTS